MLPSRSLKQLETEAVVVSKKKKKKKNPPRREKFYGGVKGRGGYSQISFFRPF